jgi:hypothetical protein
VAALFPQVAHSWNTGAELTEHIDHLDREGADRLLDAGATWIVVRSNDDLPLECPYTNSLVAVCHLSPRVAPYVARSRAPAAN